MPPKPKFTREEVIDAALSLISEEGIGALTTRSLGQRLGSSARPIFTVFKNMEELTDAVRAAAMTRYEACIREAEHSTPVFKQYGLRMLLFARDCPKLFQFLFMREHRGATRFEDVFVSLGSTAPLCIDVLRRDYALSETEARTLFQQVWIYTYGLAVLCASGMCRFSEQELSQMLSREFSAVMYQLHRGDADLPTLFDPLGKTNT
ncbi:MAG: TetR/AcrR family transcriptional regulator [Eubacteriales bacterium]